MVSFWTDSLMKNVCQLEKMSDKNICLCKLEGNWFCLGLFLIASQMQMKLTKLRKLFKNLNENRITEIECLKCE